MQGASKVTKVGSESIRGVKTTHYAVVIDVDKAVLAAPPAAQDAMRQLAGLYTVKTLPLDVWLDAQQRVRRYQQTLDLSTLKLPAAAKANNVLGSQLSIKFELYDFGAPVDVQVPAPDQVTDLAQLGALAGGSGSGSQVPAVASGAFPPAKAAYVAQANAICQVMNDKTQALGDPGTDPLKEAMIFEQGVAITGAALGQLRALVPPPGDAVMVQAIFAKVELVLADAAQESVALRAGDQAKAQTIMTKLNADSTAANDASNAYGLTVCGS